MKKRNRVAFFNILSTLLLRGISIFTMPLFTRLLGDRGYGVTEIYNTWTAVFAIVFTLQTHATLVNARIEYPQEDQKRYQSSVMTLSLVFFLGCSAVILCFLGPVARLLKIQELLVLFMLAQAFGTFCIEFLNTKYIYEFKAGRNMVLSVAVALLTLGLSLVFILPMPAEINYLGRITAIAATYTVIGFPICAVILWKGRSFIRKDYWKFCLILAIPAIFHNLSDLILGQSDKVMVQQMLSDAALGRYSAALRFGGIMFTIFQALNNSWCPFFFEDLKQGDIQQVRRKAANFLELFTVLSLGFILLSREVYTVYVSEQFWAGTMLIPVFVTSYYLNFLCTFPVNYEYYHKQTKIVAGVTIFSSLLNLGLNYVFIRTMGMAGAAVATAASHGIQLTLHVLYCRFLLGKKDYPFDFALWGKPALCFAAGLVLVYAGQNLWLLRWSVGAALGLWELYRIRTRTVLI